MNKSIGWSIALSVIMILVGLFAIIVPAVAGLAAALYLGWLLLFCGVAHLVFAWHRRGAGAVIGEVLMGILYLLAGFYLIINPGGGLLSLTLLLAGYLFAEAIIEFYLAFQRGKLGGPTGWLWFDGIISLVLAVMIWRTWPVSSAWFVGTLVGFGILFTAFSRLMLSMHAKGAAAATA